MPFRRMQWLFPIAVTLHNGEEVLFMPSWISDHRGQIPLHPSTAAIWVALLLLTAGAYAVTALSAMRGRQSVWTYLLFGYVAAMLINVFVPHVPVAMVFRTYAPGVITAVVVNLPIMSTLLFQAVREQWVSGIRAAVYAVLVPLAMGMSIVVLFSLA